MNNFCLSRSRRCDENNVAVAPSSLELGKVSDCPVVFEGADVLDSVCPVSSLTGNRMSIYEALQMVGSEKYSRALDFLFPDIPEIMSDSRLSDDDRVELLSSRLNTGSPSEDARLRESLSKIVQDFKVQVETPPSASVSESKIESPANE